MRKPTAIMELLLPVEVVPDLLSKAKNADMAMPEYLGIQALKGAYGHKDPDVLESAFRDTNRITGTETRKGEQ